jgi:hypothetical protein
VAAPTLATVVGSSASGNVVSIANSLALPVAGDLRILVVTAQDRGTAGQGPLALTIAPAGWTYLYMSPQGAGQARSWVFYKKFVAGDPTVSATYSFAVPYVYMLAKVTGYNQASNGPIVAVPRGQSAKAASTTMKSLGVIAEAEALRLDFWTAGYTTNANSASATITPPVTQNGSATFKPSTTNGYIGRVGSENTLGYGWDGDHFATLGIATANALATAIIVGGWKVLSRNITSGPTLTKSSVGRKAVTRNTSTTLNITGAVDTGSGRHTSGATSTTMNVSALSRRVFLTRTNMTLTSTTAGVHNGAGVEDGGLDLSFGVRGTHTSAPAQTSQALGLKSEVVARIGGGQAPTPSYVDQFTATYVPTLKPLRGMFQGIRNGQWYNWDVPIRDLELTFTMSGASMIKGKIGPEDLVAVEHIDAWATWLHIEEGGQIRASGILQPLAVQDGDLVIEAMGFLGYPQGIAYAEESQGILLDPAYVIRFLWDYLQKFNDAKLGVTYDDTATPKRLGEDEKIDIVYDDKGQPVYKYAEIYDAKVAPDIMIVKKEGFPVKAWATLLSWGYTIYQNPDKELLMLVYPPDYAWATCELPAVIERATYSDGTIEDKWMVPDFKFTPMKPYVLQWWNDTDIGQEIANLAKNTPMDMAESWEWTADKLGVKPHLKLGYPRLGTRRADLRFAEDENLLAAVLLRETPDLYASEIMFRGAGEGRDGIRAQAGKPDPKRIRRYKVINDKTVVDKKRAQANADDEYRRRTALLTITEITIDATHDNAPMGSFSLGDDILVQCWIPYIGDVKLWHRIVSYTWRPDKDEVVIQLRRSEQFVYPVTPVTPAAA